MRGRSHDMTKRIVKSDSAPAPIGPYSQAVEMGDFLFCSGQIGLNAETGEVVSGGVKEQTEQVMLNIGAVLAAADMKFEHVVKTTIFLTNMADFTTVNEVYGRHFSKNPPARSTVAVAGLPKGVKVEIEVIARRH